MALTKETVIQQVRQLAQTGIRPSEILRETLALLELEQRDRQTLVRLCAKAFCFNEGEGHTIFGWQPDGSGYLQDAELDVLLSKKMAWFNVSQTFYTS